MPLTTDQAYDLLASAKERSRLGHAFLITGPTGVGKEELAQRIITLLNERPDTAVPDMFGEMPEPEPTAPEGTLDMMQSEFTRIVRPRSKSRLIKVDDMRALEDSFYLSAPAGQWKIGVIVDADRMNESAANAFLKTLEEPPQNCLLLLLTTAPDRLLTTILSRCISIPLYRVGQDGPSEAQSAMNAIIQANLQTSSRGLIPALGIKADFEAYLGDQKNMINKKHQSALKAELANLKQVTEDRNLIKAREEQALAEESADYLGLRTESVNALISWFGDLIRWKVGQRPSIFSGSDAVFARFAEDLPVHDVLQRIEALEDLRFLLNETNVSEALALETCFMNAFGEA